MAKYEPFTHDNQSPFSTIHNLIACRDAGVQDRVVINWKESGFVGWDDQEGSEGSNGFICQYKGKNVYFCTFSMLILTYIMYNACF